MSEKKISVDESSVASSHDSPSQELRVSGEGSRITEFPEENRREGDEEIQKSQSDLRLDRDDGAQIIAGILEKAIGIPVAAGINSIIDNYLRKDVVPVPGAMLYCDLAAGYIEHSGIYVGGGEKCIVELTNDRGESRITMVTPKEFISGGIGRSIYVSCIDNDASGSDAIAETALNMVGRDLGRYNLLTNNCHMFTDYCLRCGQKPNKYHGQCMRKEDYLKHFRNREMTLTYLKNTAREILKANEWRIWHYKKS